MKIVVIGGGSTYTPELVNGFLECIKTFPLSELCVADFSQSAAASSDPNTLPIPLLFFSMAVMNIYH